ncbi:MAG: GAF domain-containing protein [Chloroflexi bacterium]|nr:GAF domain-containing protein [Chloroflexota bacterium]
MTTKAELEQRLAELEAAQVRAEMLYQISRDLNMARDTSEFLQVLARPARDAETHRATLWYIDLDQAGEPEWLKLVAHWEHTGELHDHVGVQYYLPEFHLADLWLSSTNKPLLIADTSTDARLDEAARNIYIAEAKTRATAILPLTQGGHRVGLFTFNWTETHEFGEREMVLYQALVDLVAPVVAAHRMAQDAHARAEELMILNDLSRTLTTCATVEEVMNLVYKSVGLLMDATNFDIGLYDPDKNLVTFLFNTTESVIDREVTSMPADQGITGYIIRNRVPVLIQDDYQEWLTKIGTEQVGEPVRSWLGVPMMLGDQVLGVINVQSYDIPFLYGKDQRDLLVSIANQAAVTLKNVQVMENLEQRIQERTAELSQILKEQEQLQQEVIDAQKQALQELSTPIIPIMEQIIVMPLIGSIDTMRARDITRSLLAGIRHHQAKVVILDITGVPIVDSGVASYLNRTIQAARLKGAHTIVTGISEAVAETIVELGIDWTGIETLPDLQTGLRSALIRLGRRIVG